MYHYIYEAFLTDPKFAKQLSAIENRLTDLGIYGSVHRLALFKTMKGTIQDAVRRGGFGVSVAGRRRGKGSSREQAPYAERAAGIRLLVAGSFERIYRQNAINLGMLVTTDFSVLEKVRRATPAPLTVSIGFAEHRDPGRILDAVATNGLDTIVFQIPGSGVHTISPVNVLM